jgi:hypothetical protein
MLRSILVTLRMAAISVGFTLLEGCLTKPNPLWQSNGTSEGTEGTAAASDSTAASASTSGTTSTSSPSGDATGTVASESAETGESTGGTSGSCVTDCPGDVEAFVVDGTPGVRQRYKALGWIDAGSSYLVAAGADESAAGLTLVVYDPSLVEQARRIDDVDGYAEEEAWALTVEASTVFVAAEGGTGDGLRPFVRGYAVDAAGDPQPGGFRGLQGGRRPRGIVAAVQLGELRLIVVGQDFEDPERGFISVVTASNFALEYDSPHSEPEMDVVLTSVTELDEAFYSGASLDGGPAIGTGSIFGASVSDYAVEETAGALQAIVRVPAANELLVGGWLDDAPVRAHVARVTTTGALVWQADWDEAARSEIEALDVDERGTVYGVGSWQDVAGGPSLPWVVALSAAGDELWSRTYPDELGSPAGALQNVVARDGAIFVVGSIADAAGDEDALIARLRP